MHSGPMLATILCLVIDAVTAQPMPPLPPRPSNAPSTAPPPAPLAEPLPSTARENDPTRVVAESDPCLTRLKAAGFDVEAAEHASGANDLCRIESPVRLKAVPARFTPEDRSLASDDDDAPFSTLHSSAC